MNTKIPDGTKIVFDKAINLNQARPQNQIVLTFDNNNIFTFHADQGIKLTVSDDHTLVISYE